MKDEGFFCKNIPFEMWVLQCFMGNANLMHTNKIFISDRWRSNVLFWKDHFILLLNGILKKNHFLLNSYIFYLDQLNSIFNDFQLKIGQLSLNNEKKVYDYR